MTSTLQQKRLKKQRTIIAASPLLPKIVRQYVWSYTYEIYNSQ